VQDQGSLRLVDLEFSSVSTVFKFLASTPATRLWPNIEVAYRRRHRSESVAVKQRIVRPFVRVDHQYIIALPAVLGHYFLSLPEPK
jgi:hypothetical protein